MVHVSMKVPLILLLCCFCSGIQVWPSSQLPCRVYLRINYGRYWQYYYLPSYVQPGKFLCCNDAALTCCKELTNHINRYLGYGVAYIRDAAASRLCNIVKREILPSNPTHVYARWSISNSPCYNYGEQYLGQLCCWKYLVDGAPVYVNNPSCSQCVKPNCTKASTWMFSEPEQPNDPILELNENPDPEFSPARSQESSQDKSYPFHSKRIPGFDTLNLNEKDQLPGFNTLDLNEKDQIPEFDILNVNEKDQIPDFSTLHLNKKDQHPGFNTLDLNENDERLGFNNLNLIGKKKKMKKEKHISF